jgi:hypothetical protein
VRKERHEEKHRHLRLRSLATSSLLP